MLWRWRAIVPFLYLVLVADQIVRRRVAWAEAALVTIWINLGLLLVGLALSLAPS